MPLLPHPVMLFNIRTAESGKLPTAAKKTSVGCTFFHTLLTVRSARAEKSANQWDGNQDLISKLGTPIIGWLILN